MDDDGTRVVHAPNIIAVDADGCPLCPDTLRVLSEDEYAAYLREVCKGIEDSRPLKPLLFLHGGFNSLKRARRRAVDLTPKMERAGYYPLFVIWRSGLLINYMQHLFWLRQGRIYRWWGPLTSPFYLLADIVRGIGRMPITLFHQIVTDLVTTLPGRFRWRRNADVLYGILRSRFEESQSREAMPAIAVHRGEDQRGLWEMLGRHLLYFVTFAPQIPIIALLDAMGKSSWKTMRRRTGTMFRRPSEFNPTSLDPRSGTKALDSPATGATAVFLEQLETLLAKPDHENRPLTVIGHSMGTIIVNEILVRHSGLPYDKIVYMAAACSIRDFERSVVPILAHQPDAHFFNLCLHPVAEAREIQWALLDLPPRGTLLEWIDNFLEDPERIVDRVLGKWDNVIQATHIIDKSVRPRVHLKAFGIGSPLDLRRHGEFTRKEFWSSDFLEIPVPPRPQGR